MSTSTSQPDRKGKRKLVETAPEDEGDAGWTSLGGELEIPSEDEDGASEASDEGEEEEFPEIDAESDGSSSAGDEEGSESEAEDRSSEASSSVEDTNVGIEGLDITSESSGDSLAASDDEVVPGVYPKAKVVTSEITGGPKRVYPEIEPVYDSDSSTEDNPNRVGRIPMHWYDDLPHIGYDINGKRILRPARGDELDKFLATAEDPAAWMSGFDHTGQKDIELSTEELDIIRRLQEAEVPDGKFNPYEDTVEWFTGKGKEEVMPLSGRPQPKSRWQPSKWERQKILKTVRLIRAGKILPNKPKATQSQWYALWATESEPTTKRLPQIAAPKIALPKHAESYNPPEEYLLDEEEKAKYESLDKEDQLRTYLPKKYGSLRLVPAYPNFIQERNSRLLDLYLAPRIQRVRLNINPESLLPSLPSPASLKPFPVFEGMKMSGGGTSRARCLSVSPDGVWAVSGGEDGIVRLWETFVGREAARWKLGSRVGAVEWCPRKDVSFFLAGLEDEIYAFMPPYLPPGIEAATFEVLDPRNPPQPGPPATGKTVKWSKESVTLKASSSTYSAPLVVIGLPPGSGLPKQITFHRKGDYFASVASREGQNGVWIHQISKRHSQSPFKKIKGAIQTVLFHPTQPHFFVATQRYIRIYDLVAQSLLKTLQTSSQWISSMDVHPSGNHLIVGGYDKKLFWFDLELGTKPYKTLRYHTKAIRSVAFSSTYPLFASSSDDGTIQIFHARVYNDFTTDPLIVPLKVLRGHEIRDSLEGLQLSLLAGRIFIKDFRYHSRNQSIRVLKCHITWRYWLWRTQSVLNGSENDGDGEQAHKSEKALALPCRLHAGLEGVEVFFYNRTPAYDEIIRQFEPPAGEGATDANVRGSSSEETAARPRGISLDDPQVRKSTRATVQTHETPQPSTGRWTRFLGPIRRAYASVREWMRGVKPSFDWNDVLPVSFEATTCAIIAGNNSTPSILIADIQKVTGTYGITQCRSSYDLYKNVYQLHLSSVKLITRTNPDYEVPMLERGQKIHAELERSCPESIQHSGFLRFDAFRRLVRFSYNIIHKATPKPPPKWRGLARYMTDAQRREAGELTHEVEYGKVTTLLETPALEATYYVDAAGLVPEDARNLGDTGREVVDVGNGDLAPEWAVELTLYGGTITYGPWADRQRDTLQRAFFPPTYVSRDPTARLSPGSYRLHTSLLIVLELRESVVLRLPTREPSKDWKYDGIAPLADTRKKKDKRPFGWLDVSIGPSSTLTYNMAMVADEAGYRNTLEVHLREPSVSSSVNGTLFWRNQACRVLCDMPSPLKWDGFRQWTFDITFMTPNLYILRDHTTLITDLISDWTSGPPSDFNTWVPTVYSFKFGLKDYTINLYVNDHNVIDHPLADDKNSLLVLSGSSANVHLNVPADKFRPAFRTTTFWVEIPTLQVGMSLPDWNTHYTFARERPMSLGTIGFLRLDSSYTSYPEVHPDHVEKFVLDIKARRALFKCHAWSIRHFLRLKDNYFGRFTHFSTLQEYMEKKSDGIIGDDILAKYRKGKSDVFEVCLSVNVSDSQVILPQEIHDCKAAVILSAPELQVFLRLNDYFLEMSLNIAPATLFATDDHMEVVKQTRPRRFKGGRILLGSIDIVANRLLGPQPETATYLCIWEIRLGSIRAILLPRLVWSLHAAARAFANNYPDALNAPDSGFELPLDPDMTFLKVVLPSADITLKDENTALHVVLPRGVSLDYNDVAGKTYRKVTSIHLPVADVKTLLRSPYKKDNWFEVASAKFDIHADIYSSPPGWEEDAARQLRFVTTQDSLTKRLRFLSGHGGQPVTSKMDHDAGNRNAFDILVPNLRLSLLQRVDEIQERTNNIAGAPTQLLTSSNLHISHFAFFISQAPATVVPSSSHTQSTPDSLISLQVKAINLHVHTATSHPRSKAFVPRTLLHAVLAPLNFALRTYEDTSGRLDIGCLRATLGGKSPELIASTFQSAIRFASKIATTATLTGRRERRRRQHMVHQILQFQPDKTVWVDPLSWTQTSFIVKSGLPSRLRSDLSWKILAHLRHRLRETNPSKVLDLQKLVESMDANIDPPPVADVSTLMAGQEWMDWTHDQEEESHRPVLLDMLYPASVVQRALNDVRHSGAFKFYLGRLRSVLADNEGAHTVIVAGPLWSRLQTGQRLLLTADPGTGDEAQSSVLHIFGSLRVDNCGVRVSPTFIPFLSDVLRVQRRAASPKVPKGVKKIKRLNSSPIGPMIIETTIEVGQARLEASALKVILDVRASGVRLVTNASVPAEITGSDYASCSVAVMTEEFRIGTKATPAGSKHAADQETLAEIVFSKPNTSILVREAELERNVNIVVWLSQALIHVPRSALKLYHFSREWRQEYTSKYDIMVRDLLTEIEKTGGRPAPSQPRTRKATIFRTQASLKRLQMLLQVMHGTWVSWTFLDSIIFMEGHDGSTLSHSFGVDLKSQTVDITSQAGESTPLTPSSSAIRLPLPRFTISGKYGQDGMQCSSTLGFFSIRLKPQYVDDILVVQQKFGSDFNDLLDLYTQKRDDSPLSSSQPVPRTGPTTPMTVTVQLQGFSISLEGPSSTQYLNAAVIDGTVVNRPGEGVTWDARASSLSLSLAHHSAPHATRSSFNRKFRSAYMDVEFYADNVRPRGTPSTEKHFNLRVIRIHAVMQPAAFGELGDLVDYVQAEMLLRKEQRSVELAEIRKKGKLLRTKLERETSTTKEQEESWLDERVVMIEVRSVGVAFPLSTDDNFMPSHTPLETTIPFVPSSVRAFLFSVRSIRFSAQKYEKGDMDVEDFSFQFVPDFDQSIAVHFEGDTHQTHNRLLLPSMKAAVQSELDGQSRRILAVANVNGLILDLDTSITGYVFSLIDVYRQGKERIERLAPGQARANIEALSARFASAQAEQSSIAVLSTNFLAKLDFHSGRVRLFAPESSRMDPHTRLLFRESSMIDPLSALSDVGTETSIDTIVLPRLSVDADFTGASASEKFSASEAAALSYLRISAVVYTSKNTIWPSVLPFLVEVVRNIERRMDEPHVSPVHVQPVASTPVEPLATSSTNIIPVAESVIGSQLHVQFTLKVDASHLALTCQPDVNVVAALEWQSSQILVTIEPITHEVKLVGTIGGIKASLRHEYLRESSVTAEARDLTFSIAMGRILQGPDTNYVPSLSISLKTELLGRLRFSRLQDLLCFKAVWLDRIPVFEPRARAEAPPTPLAPPIKAPSSSEPQPRSGIVIVVIAVVKTVDLEVDLGHAITNLRLELQDLIVRRYQNRETSTLSLSIGPVALSATRSLSGELTMPQFEFKTERQINRNRTEDGLHVNQLVVQINTGDIDLHVRYDEFKLLGFHADPIEAKVWDDWTNLPNEDHGLRLDFSLSGGKIQVIGTMQAASYLISTAAKVKAVLRAQQEGAARESRAFRTTLHPKPANPLSDVAAAMLTSARSRFQEAEEYDFTIIQQMRCTIAHIRLELVDGGRTYDMHANTIVAVLERFVRTQDDAPQRDLQLVLGSFTVRSFPALPGLDLNAIPANPTNIFLFPQVNLHMKSTLHLDTQLLDYEFESAFPLQLGKNVGNEIYFILDAVEYFQLHGRWKDLKSRVTEALTDPIFQEKDNDWWNQPIRSNSLGESILSREGGSGSGSGSGLALSQIPEPAAGSSARPSTLTYHSIRTQIETPRFRQLHQSQITNDTFLSLTGINVKENLPCWVHEYATVPIESIMKLLLRIYAQRLRKGEAFVETVSAPRGHAPPPEAFPFPPLAPGSPRAPNFGVTVPFAKNLNAPLATISSGMAAALFRSLRCSSTTPTTLLSRPPVFSQPVPSVLRFARSVEVPPIVRNLATAPPRTSLLVRNASPFLSARPLYFSPNPIRSRFVNPQFFSTTIPTSTGAIEPGSAEAVPNTQAFTSSPLVYKWLFGCSLLVFAIVVVGGVTRLTESGLSITEWKPFTGTIPPLTRQQWEEEFDKYKATPEFKLLNHRITLEEFKSIFYMEYSHRVLGRFIGLVYVVPLAFFIASRRLSPKLTPKLVGLGALLGFQGFLGWYMVKSGLEDELMEIPGAVPRVSQYRLAAHLAAALVLYCGMLATAVGLRTDWKWAKAVTASEATGGRKTYNAEALSRFLASGVGRRFRGVAWGLGALVFTTAISGAFVAGLDAGLLYNEFPLMGGRLAPPADELFAKEYAKRPDQGDLWWRNLFENPTTVQFNHRCLAMTTYASTLALFLSTKYYTPLRSLIPPLTQRAVTAVFHAANLQVLLGISTLLYLVPVPLAATHQAGSVLLLSCVVGLLSSLRRPGAIAQAWRRARMSGMAKSDVVNRAGTMTANRGGT
ncbi:hypothetical protein FRB99_005016 [Tulasnella sp. 403]|nr:hypothetical protein FRB99_005016 [Tulasnella sp. 403]